MWDKKLFALSDRMCRLWTELPVMMRVGGSALMGSACPLAVMETSGVTLR